jgi:hypothetical protein
VKSEEFIREVDEELQRERLAVLWKRYGGLVIGLALLAVIGTAAKVGWDQWRRQAEAAEAAEFAAAEQALAASRPADAAAAFAALAVEGETGYAALARLKEAEAKLALKDEAGAAAALDALGAAGRDDPILRDLGTLLAASRELDEGDPAALRARLEPIAAAGAPWRDHARELLAVLAIRTGDLGTARNLLSELSSGATVPQSLRQRAQELLQAIGGAPEQASS